jgi:hypothetical protein
LRAPDRARWSILSIARDVARLEVCCPRARTVKVAHDLYRSRNHVNVLKRILPLAFVALSMTSAAAAGPPKAATGPKAMVAAANPMAVEAGL